MGSRPNRKQRSGGRGRRSDGSQPGEVGQALGVDAAPREGTTAGGAARMGYPMMAERLVLMLALAAVDLVGRIEDILLRVEKSTDGPKATSRDDLRR